MRYTFRPMKKNPRGRRRESSEETRERILEAARARFGRYGYRKTTMAEIAGDLGMSAANLYRYFSSKEEIMSGCMACHLEERAALLRGAVGACPGDWSSRFETFVVTLVQHTRALFQQMPTINELITELTATRADLAYRKIRHERALIAELLKAGREAGEFHFDDLDRTAAAVQSALVKFSTPLFVPVCSDEEHELAARQTARLLVRALTCSDRVQGVSRER